MPQRSLPVWGALRFACTADSLIIVTRHLPKLLIAVLLSALLEGCALPGSVPAPTPYPEGYIPTVIFLTAQAINAATMAAMPTPTGVPTLEPTSVVPVTPPPTVTATPGPSIPTAAIQINAPGPMSRIASPVEVHAWVSVDKGYRLETALYDETGQVISRSSLLTFNAPGSFPLSAKLPFEIRAAGETGTVQITAKDSHGRIQSLNSVRVLLLSTGVSQVNPPGNMIYERVAFYDLPVDAHISGGVLPLKGSYSPINGKPVVLELIGDDGKSLGLRVLGLAGDGSQYFETTIPFKVARETAARIFLYQDDDVIQGRAYVYSQPLALEP
jgi:hypothetical protein